MPSWTRTAALAVPLFAAACSDAQPLASTPRPTAAAAVEARPQEPAPASSDALADALASANPGATVHLRAIVREPAGLRANATWTGGKLVVFSGTASAPTRLYEDASLGPTTAPTRVLFSATNTGAAPLRFAALLTNLGSQPGTLELVRAGASVPGTHPRRALERWLTSSGSAVVGVPAGATVRIDPLFGDGIAAPGARADGIWDLAFDRPHRITVCALRADGPAECSPLPMASREGQIRGTFPWSERALESAPIDAHAGPAHLPLGSADLRGVDAPSGASVALPNNLGVLRRVQLPALAEGAPNLALVLSARVPGAAARASAGITPGGPVLMPEQLAEGDGSLVGTFAPDDGPITLEYLATPGATPAELIAVPF